MTISKTQPNKIKTKNENQCKKQKSLINYNAKKPFNPRAFNFMKKSKNVDKI